MRFLHLADLHFGKTLHHASLIENGDQHYWVQRILELVDREKPDAVVIAGDVYDRGVPPREAVSLLSDFLTELAGSKRNIPVLMIAGNHDGAERLDFAAPLLKNQNVYIAGTLRKEIQRVTLKSDGAPVNFYLMPYLFPIKVRDLLGLSIDEVPDYETATRKLLEAQEIDFSERNVLVAHQFVTSMGVSPSLSDSELSVGGTGAMDVEVFDGFDYVALGHIHNAQHIGKPSVRYAGAPLCYHFSEVGQKKDALMVTLGEKGADPVYEYFTIPALHPMRNIHGKFADIVEQEQNNTQRGEYVAVVLTDASPVYHAAETLRTLFDSHGTKMLDITFQPESKKMTEFSSVQEDGEKTLQELFSDFYQERNGEYPMEEDRELIEHLAHRIQSNADVDDETLVEELIQLAINQEECR